MADDVTTLGSIRCGVAALDPQWSNTNDTINRITSGINMWYNKWHNKWYNIVPSM